MSRYQFHNQRCEECGNSFDSSRYDARFCGATCRSRAHRKEQARDKAIERAKKAIDDLRQYYKSPVVVDVMHDLIKWMTNATAEHEFYVDMRRLDEPMSDGNEVQ